MYHLDGIKKRVHSLSIIPFVRTVWYIGDTRSVSLSQCLLQSADGTGSKEAFKSAFPGNHVVQTSTRDLARFVHRKLQRIFAPLLAIERESLTEKESCTRLRNSEDTPHPWGRGPEREGVAKNARYTQRRPDEDLRLREAASAESPRSLPDGLIIIRRPTQSMSNNSLRKSRLYL